MSMTSSLRARTLRALFDRYMRWRLKEMVHPEYPVLLEYPICPKPRYGEGKPAHPELAALLGRNDEAYSSLVVVLSAFSKTLLQIPERACDAGPGDPCWDNPFFSALDAIALYGLLGSRKPARYFEIGSGNSTMFARRAVRDLGLSTRIVSLDPAPRAEVDALSDRVIRQPLEDVDTALFDELEAGDMLFVDNSHRVFQNSDVTVFFLEVLPRLKSGVTVHVHDIFLPFDYPHIWKERHYSEQYLLAAYLLGGYSRLVPLLPLAYLGHHPSHRELIDDTWAQPLFQRAFAHYRKLTGGYIGTSFWMDLK